MRKNNSFKKTVAAGLVLLMTASLAACDGKKTDTKTEDKKTETKADKEEDVELQVFIAASLNTQFPDLLLFSPFSRQISHIFCRLLVRFTG